MRKYFRGRGKESGVMVISTALTLTALIGLAALAIDISNLMIARNELQNAADAAALAAAPCLYPRAACGNSTATAPDWTTAKQKANSFVSLNKIQGVTMQVGAVGGGYWDITVPPSSQPQPLPTTATANDLPAVQVSISKTNGNANGAIATYLAGVWGISSMNASATATAVVSRPSGVGSGGLFPITMSACMFNNYWNSTTNSPDLATSTTPLSGQTLSQTIGQPYMFQITSSYHAGPCEAGQWTTFGNASNNVPTVENLISNGNASEVDIGSSPGTYIEPGTKAVLYSDVNDCSAAGNHACEWVTVPVVNSLSAKTFQPIQGFACLHILGADQGAKTITVQMSNNADKCQTENASGVGPSYGAITPARLVQ